MTWLRKACREVVSFFARGAEDVTLPSTLGAPPRSKGGGVVPWCQWCGTPENKGHHPSCRVLRRQEFDESANFDPVAHQEAFSPTVADMEKWSREGLYRVILMYRQEIKTLREIRDGQAASLQGLEQQVETKARRLAEAERELAELRSHCQGCVPR